MLARGVVRGRYTTEGQYRPRGTSVLGFDFRVQAVLNLKMKRKRILIYTGRSGVLVKGCRLLWLGKHVSMLSQGGTIQHSNSRSLSDGNPNLEAC